MMAMFAPLAFSVSFSSVALADDAQSWLDQQSEPTATTLIPADQVGGAAGPGAMSPAPVGAGSGGLRAATSRPAPSRAVSAPAAPARTAVPSSSSASSVTHFAGGPVAAISRLTKPEPAPAAAPVETTVRLSNGREIDNLDIDRPTGSSSPAKVATPKHSLKEPGYGDTLRPDVHRQEVEVAKMGDELTMDSEAVRQALVDAWRPSKGLVSAHPDYYANVLVRLDSAGNVRSAVVLETNASDAFYGSIQKVLDHSSLWVPEGSTTDDTSRDGVVVNFTAHDAIKALGWDQ